VSQPERTHKGVRNLYAFTFYVCSEPASLAALGTGWLMWGNGTNARGIWHFQIAPAGYDVMMRQGRSCTPAERWRSDCGGDVMAEVIQSDSGPGILGLAACLLVATGGLAAEPIAPQVLTWSLRDDFRAGSGRENPHFDRDDQPTWHSRRTTGSSGPLESRPCLRDGRYVPSTDAGEKPFDSPLDGWAFQARDCRDARQLRALGQPVDPSRTARSAALWLAGCIGSWLCTTAVHAEDQAEFFHQKVEPILRQHCYDCHSHEAGQMESGLALDWKSGWVTGGERGPAIVPGRPDASLLIRAVEHSDPELAMPEEKLADGDIDTLIQWVRDGAYDDRTVEPRSEDALEWWSLKPLVAPPVPAGSAGDSAVEPHPIDAFVETRLAAAGLAPSPAAEPRELIRRLYFDLVGLPPSPDDVARFLADPSAEAYRRLVDRLLDSPRYGERWARHWFDTIHFADSHGYEHDVGRDHAWPYRDYVIGALNRDTPWPTFVRQQLAVDHFEPEATELIPALGFLGAGTFDFSTYSTGPVTFDYLDRDDMLTQTMAAFVSTTANCARCHAHKFDPITQADYYALQAVFAGALKGDIRYDADAATAAERQRLIALQEAATRRDPGVLRAEPAVRAVEQWLGQRGPGATWTPLDLQSFVSSEGATLTKTADGIVLAGGPAPETDNYILTATSALRRISALRLDLYPHDSLPMKGPGRCQNGNLHLSEVLLTVFEPGTLSGKPVPIARATADFNQDDWSVEHAVDGNAKTAWGIHPAVGQPHHAVFELAQPLELAAGASLTITLRQLHGGAHLIGAFRLSATDAPAAQAVALPGDLEQTWKAAASGRTPEQQLTLAAHVVKLAVAAELSRLPAQSTVYAVGASVAIPTGNGNYQPASIGTPKVVHVLQRGDIGQPRAVAEPGALSALQHAPARFAGLPQESEAARRAALADWIAHPGNVLTWRSAVNRVWHYHFGRGLCDTPSDFGRMGGTPSHPELIDWLAVWFRDQAHGSLKQLHRLMVTSRTYQQSSRTRGDAAVIDADNRLLWRRNPLRLDADAYRDFVLSVSGRMDFSMGGPAIQHFRQSPGPQLTPELNYAAYDWSSPGANRRSVYRCVWRGIPDPLMAALDFPDLGLLAPARGFSASPLQALALYNNNFVLFHSEAMARRISERTGDVEQQIRQVTQLAYGRDPSESEREPFRSFVTRHGLAALCRVILNSNEFLFVP
jgi:hypothetical protein